MRDDHGRLWVLADQIDSAACVRAVAGAPEPIPAVGGGGGDGADSSADKGGDGGSGGSQTAGFPWLLLFALAGGAVLAYNT